MQAIQTALRQNGCMQATRLGLHAAARAATALLHSRKAATRTVLETAATCDDQAALEAALRDAAAFGLTKLIATAEAAIEALRTGKLQALREAVAEGGAADVAQATQACGLPIQKCRPPVWGPQMSPELLA